MIRELTEMEVEAVSGGDFVGPITVAPQVITQINAPVQAAVAVGGDAVNLINGGLANLGFQSVA
jgi:hypothetical protein